MMLTVEPEFQEAVTFAENYVPQETWEILPDLDEKIKLRWIMAGKSSGSMCVTVPSAFCSLAHVAELLY